MSTNAILAVTKEVYLQTILLRLGVPKPILNTPTKKTQDNYYWYFECTEWDNNSDELDTLLNWLSNLTPQAYGMAVVNDNNHYDFYGSPEDFDIYAEMHVSGPEHTLFF